ncbi:MAG: arsenite methyltransferase [Acidimicrobiales bacterium]
MTEQYDIREAVRRRYAAAAGRFAGGGRRGAQALDASCCGPATVGTIDAEGHEVFGPGLYGEEVRGDLSDDAVAASLGCGVPTAVADLCSGETVLDLGSGGGGDVVISASRVAPDGKVIGLDMTTEMLELARANATAAGVTNVEFLHGYLEEIPLPAASVDVVISNCVINLAADKRVVLAEVARVLRPGGRMAISDILADPDMDAETRSDVAAWTGCVAGALTEAELRQALTEAGFTGIEITETHRVHRHAGAAIIRASR